MKPIETDEEYEAIVREMDTLWEREPGSDDEKRLYVLARVADAYSVARGWSAPR